MRKRTERYFLKNVFLQARLASLASIYELGEAFLHEKST